ncbi:glycosyltransferase family A protein [Actinocrispum sp. NPDC049592]|uniref:glycosyltransferase family A protein n=1 Tax=Actinocrispum sp. NPDC049592 TaxID=3154835 RepID=UPI003441B282
MPALATVIVPNYNHAQSLPLCLAAIKQQTYAPLEIVVVDDASTDDSVRIAESAGVTVLRNERNEGPSVARNRGAEWASGQFLFFVDSDGALAPDAVANAVALLEADPDLGAVCGIDDAEPLTIDSRVEEYRALQHHYWCVASEGEVSFLFSAMFAIRAKVFREVGPFNPRLRLTEEVDYGNRLAQSHRMVSTSAVTGKLDHDHLLSPLLGKLFHRVRARVPLYTRRKRFAQGYETPARAGSSVFAALAVLTLPVALLLGPVWLALPALLLAGSLACDARMYRFVLARRGLPFTLFFAGVHFLVNLTIIGGLATGMLQWLASPRFRRLYDSAPVTERART